MYLAALSKAVIPFGWPFILVENMTDVDWHLTYNSLKVIHPYQLCMVGKCKVCGGRLCIEQKTFGIVTTDDFLAAAYRHLYQFHHDLCPTFVHKGISGKVCGDVPQAKTVPLLKIGWHCLRTVMWRECTAEA